MNQDMNTFSREKFKQKQEEFTKTKKELLEKNVEIDNIVKALNGESFDLTNWVADNIFRPDNKKRKKEATKELKELNRLVSNSIKKIDTFTMQYETLADIANDMKKWTDAILNLVQMGEVNFIIPQYKNTKAKEVNIAQIVVGAVGGIATVLSMGAIAPLAISASALTLFIGGIVAGEDRKKEFEDIEKKAIEAQDKLKDDLIVNLDDGIKNIDEFVSNASLAFENANLLFYKEENKVISFKKDEMTLEKLAKVVSYQTIYLSNMNSEFNSYITTLDKYEKKGKLTKSRIRNMAEDRAMGLVDDEEEEEMTHKFMTAYYINKGCSQEELSKYESKEELCVIDKISTEVEISKEEVKKMVAYRMLTLEIEPNKIAHILNIDIKEVDKMKSNYDSMLELNKTLEPFAA